ncbi:MAG: hypothetical protein A2V70_11500 [Planctomycetes bacterium RBG_13_63_9]|nr:MAG: hypothetical protein A2V70_11500 [Planctomycetes bacterium RBG_13_63_9]
MWSGALLLVLLLMASGQTLGQAIETTETAAETAADTSPTAHPDAELDLPRDAVWSVALDVEHFVGHPLGQKVLELVDHAIRTETSRGTPDGTTALDLATLRLKITPVLGFDPLEGISRIVAYGPFPADARNDDELVQKMAANSVVAVWLKGTTGNLEGLALATPDYQSAEYNGATIHSGRLPDFPPRVYMAIDQPRHAQGKKLVVFALQEDQLKQVLDRLKEPVGTTVSPSDNEAEDRVPGEIVTASVRLDAATIRALQIPEQQSAVVKMLQRLTLSVGAQEDCVFVQATIEVVDEQRAEQVRQLLQGAIAFVQLPIEELEEEEGFLMVREAIRDIQVSRSGNRVICRMQKPLDRVMAVYPKLIEALD